MTVHLPPNDDDAVQDIVVAEAVLDVEDVMVVDARVEPDAVTVVDAAPDADAQVEAASAPSASLPVADLIVGAAATGVNVTVTVVRGARWVGRAGRPLGRVMLRPPMMPASLQPATWLEAGARRGAQQRAQAEEQLSRFLDAAVPMLVEQIVRRIDLTALVAQRVDLDVVIRRIDLVALAEQVLDGIDLPEVIRESTGSVASETVRGARMQSIAADEAISRAVDRLLFRRNRPSP